MVLNPRQIKLLILDMDGTLVIPRDKDFYSQYSSMTIRSIAEYYNLSTEESLSVGAFFRKEFGGAEKALFNGDIETYFPHIENKAPNYSVLYKNLNEIDVSDQFVNRCHISKTLKDLRNAGVRIVLLTSSPDELAEKILKESGYDANADFDKIMAYQRDSGPSKIVSEQKAFQAILDEFSCFPENSLSIGDSLEYDIAPARRLGIHTFLISSTPVDGVSYCKDVHDVLVWIKENRLERENFHAFDY